MVLDAVSNFVRGSADAAVGSGDTTVSVADASIFPDPATDGEYNVVIWDANNFPRPDQDADVEVLRVTAIDTGANTLTVTRAQEGTTAAAHPNGSAIHLSPTAKMFSDVESTFADFWDASTQELTADVNNTNTTTDALESEKQSTSQGNVWDRATSSALNQQSTFPLLTPSGDVTSTIYTKSATIGGVIDGTRVPSGASLYGRLIFESGGLVDQTATVVPEVFDGNKGARTLDSLEVTIPQGNTFSLIDSGWSEIVTFPFPDDIAIGRGLLCKLDTQTNGDVVNPVSNQRFGIIFEWRLD